MKRNSKVSSWYNKDNKTCPLYIYQINCSIWNHSINIKGLASICNLFGSKKNKMTYNAPMDYILFLSSLVTFDLFCSYQSLALFPNEYDVCLWLFQAFIFFYRKCNLLREDNLGRYIIKAGYQTFPGATYHQQQRTSSFSANHLNLCLLFLYRSLSDLRACNDCMLSRNEVEPLRVSDKKFPLAYL